MALVIVGATALAVAVITGLTVLLSYVHDCAAHLAAQSRQLARIEGAVTDLTAMLTSEE
jgi:hypothetical protein